MSPEGYIVAGSVAAAIAVTVAPGLFLSRGRLAPALTSGVLAWLLFGSAMAPQDKVNLIMFTAPALILMLAGQLGRGR